MAREAVLPLIVALLLGGSLVAAYFVGSQATGKATVTITTTSITTASITATSATTSTVTFGNPIIFNYSTMPSQFFVGNYSVSMVQGVGYTIARSTGGTVRVYDYSGFYTLFAFFPLNGGLEYETLFVWNTTSGPSTSHPPYDGMCFLMQNQSSGCPFSVTTSSGISVVWTERDSTFWVSFTFE